MYVNNFIGKNAVNLLFTIHIRQRKGYVTKIHPKMVGISSRYYAWQIRDNVDRSHVIVT